MKEKIIKGIVLFSFAFAGLFLLMLIPFFIMWFIDVEIVSIFFRLDIIIAAFFTLFIMSQWPSNEVME